MSRDLDYEYDSTSVNSRPSFEVRILVLTNLLITILFLCYITINQASHHAASNPQVQLDLSQLPTPN